MNTKKKFSERLLAFFLSFIMIFTLIPTEIFAAENINISISKAPKIDIVLATGANDITNIDVTNFETDIRNALKGLGIDNSSIQKIETIETVEGGFDAESASPSTIYQFWEQYPNPNNYTLQGNVLINAVYDWNGYSASSRPGSTTKFNQVFIESESWEVGDFELSSTYAWHGCGWSSGYIFHWDKATDSAYKISAGVGNKLLLQKVNNVSNYLGTSTHFDSIGTTLAQTTGSFPTSGSGNNLKVSMKGATITISQNGATILTYTDPSPIKSGGIGLWAGCTVAYKDVQISYMKIIKKSFTDLLKESSWNDDSIRIIVNVNDYAEEDFSNPDKLASILSRCVNEKINYVSWGPSSIKSSSESFIKYNNGNGKYIETQNQNSYQSAINQTAAYIKTLIDAQSYQGNDYILVNQDLNMNVTPNSFKYNTATTDYPNGRWLINHDNMYFLNPNGQYEKTGIFQQNMDVTSFSKVGKYDIYFEGDRIKTVYVHRKPIAAFSFQVSNNRFTVLQHNSYDLDNNDNSKGLGPGIQAERWKYKASNSSVWINGIPTTLTTGVSYVVQLEVQDYQGEWSDPITKYISGSSAAQNPIADFNFSAQSISKYNTNFNITDASYDPKSYPITQYTWTVIKDDKTKIYENKSYSTFTYPPVNFLSYGAGTYAYTLKVRNSAGLESELYTKFLTVVEDTQKPEIEANPVSGDWKSQHSIQIKITDTDSQLKQYRYCISTNSTQPSQGDNSWTGTIVFPANTSLSNQSVSIIGDGIKYLHVEAIDNAGNRTVITRGPFKIDTVKPTLTYNGLTELDELPITMALFTNSVSVGHVGNKKIEISIIANDVTSGVNRVMYKLDNEVDWIDTTNSGQNKYIFRINESYVGNISVIAYDNAGIASDILLLTDFRLSNSPPVIEISNNTIWQNDNPTIFPVTIYDNTGITSIVEATFETSENINKQTGNLVYDGGNNYHVELYNEGEYTFTIHAINEAGAESYKTSEIVRIDTTPPVIEDYGTTLLERIPQINAFSLLPSDIITNRIVKIDLDISDNLSGFDYFEYQLPGDLIWTKMQPGEKTFTIDREINGDINVRATDVAGNVSKIYKIEGITVDITKPSIDIGNIPTWSNEDITIDVDVSDETLLDKVAWFTTESPDTPTAQGMTYSPATLFPGTVTLSNEGIYTLVVSAYDKAGNISKVESETIRIDKTPPEIIDLEFYMPQTETLNDEELKEENTTPSQNPPLDTPPENEIDNENENENENDSVDSNPPIITDDSQQEEGENSTPAPPVNNNNDNDEQVEDTEEDTKEDAETTEDTNENLVNESDDNVSFVLTIKHVTEDGTPIANKGAVIVKILDANSEYTSSPINIKGYTFKEMDEESAPVNGIMDSNKTIIYVYTLETVESDENENIEDEITQISQAAIPLSFVEDNIFGSNILVQIFPRDILGYANSGVDKVWYKIESDDGLTTTDWTIVSPDSKGYYFFTINKDFTGTVFARCSDIAGNMSDEYSEHIILDMTSPDPTLILNVNSTDWGLVPGEVDIQAADVNGLDSVYVEIETIEGDTIHEPFELVTMDGQKILNESFTIHEDGVYEITVTAQDIAGNSATKTKTIHIDRTAPEIHDVVFSIVDDDNQVIEYDANVTNKKLLVEVDLSDNMSGFDYMEYQTMDSPTWNRVAQGIDEFYVATAYKGNIKVRIYDKAGNVSTVFVSDEITVETDDPTLIVSKDEAWTPTGVTLHVDANDPMSGIKNVVYSYTAADGVPVTGQCDMIGDKVNTDVFFDKHGSYTITFTATDNAGNTSSVTRRVNIDRTTQFPAPDIDSHGYISGTWSDKAINVTLGYNDQSVVPISGIKKYQYKDIDTDQWIDGVPELDGYLDNSYVFRAISTVGCISDETIVFSAKIDKVAPVIVGEDAGGESSNEPLKIVVSVIEEESGIKIVEASFDGNTWFEIHANSDGNYVVDLGNEYIGDVYIKATDICGNVSDTYVVNDLVIDFERPRLVLSENSDVKDVIILKATENIKKGREGYVRIYDTKELDYIAPIAELHISNNRIKVEGEYVYINMVGLVDGQRQYAVEVDEGFVWDLANNLCYPMELSYLGTSDTKVPSLQNVIVTNPSNNESYPAVFDETKNEYNVIIPTDIVGQIIITPIFDMEIPELWATSNDIQIDYVGREDIGITIDDDYAWPVSIDIKALSKTTTVNIYRGNIEVDINTDEDIRIDEMDVLRAVDIVPFLEDGVVYTLVVNAEENYPNESDETKAYNFISTTDNFVDLSSGFNIEIWLYETKNGKTDEGRIINELQNGLEITLTIPDDMMDRDAYGIVRVHNGKAEMLRSTVNYNKITFNSDKFSSYYIAVGETVQVEVPETIIRDWGDGVPNDTYCIVPSLIGNDGIISRFSYVDENDVMNFIKPIAGNYHLTQNHKVFPDVTWNTYQWAYESIHALAARGLVAGFDDGRFGPGETITRAQLVTILARLENLPMDYTKSSFTDVDENDWFFQYVEAAYDAGLIAGIGNKQFAPNRYITRQELATILYRYMEYKGKNPDITMNKVFTDQTSISYWASNAVNAVANAGIIAGYDNGAFGPMNNATRAEASTMIWRFIRYIVDNSKDVYELTSYSEVIDE